MGLYSLGSQVMVTVVAARRTRYWSAASGLLFWAPTQQPKPRQQALLPAHCELRSLYVWSGRSGSGAFVIRSRVIFLSSFPLRFAFSLNLKFFLCQKSIFKQFLWGLSADHTTRDKHKTRRKWEQKVAGIVPTYVLLTDSHSPVPTSPYWGGTPLHKLPRLSQVKRSVPLPVQRQLEHYTKRRSCFFLIVLVRIPRPEIWKKENISSFTFLSLFFLL